MLILTNRDFISPTNFDDKNNKTVMHFEDQEHMPPLLTINKKRKEIINNQPSSQKATPHQQETLSIFPAKSGQVVEEKEKKLQRDIRMIPGQQKGQEFDKKFKNIHDITEKKEEKQRRKVNNRQKEMEKSKYLINQMMRKIDAKNISQELYPVTNETIGELIRKMDDEIDDLKGDASRKENSLSANPNNQHLKKEIQGIKASIDRCITIKELYNEKINLRNKISVLQNTIITLKEENFGLKVKINRGIETISNHMHNLPCEKEKELKLELDKSQLELRAEKEMRMKLQGNISDIVLNFKRLYEEADTARLIITNKLKELQQKEKKLSEYQPPEIQKDNPVSEKRSPQMQALEDRKQKKQPQSGSFIQPADYSQSVRKAGQYSPFNHTPASIQPGKSRLRKEERQNVAVSAFSMQQQIRKMRNNQTLLSKGQYK